MTRNRRRRQSRTAQLRRPHSNSNSNSEFEREATTEQRDILNCSSWGLWNSLLSCSRLISYSVVGQQRRRRRIPSHRSGRKKTHTQTSQRRRLGRVDHLHISPHQCRHRLPSSIDPVFEEGELVPHRRSQSAASSTTGGVYLSSSVNIFRHRRRQHHRCTGWINYHRLPSASLTGLPLLQRRRINCLKVGLSQEARKSVFRHRRRAGH